MRIELKPTTATKSSKNALQLAPVLARDDRCQIIRSSTVARIETLLEMYVPSLAQAGAR